MAQSKVTLPPTLINMANSTTSKSDSTKIEYHEIVHSTKKEEGKLSFSSSSETESESDSIFHSKSKTSSKSLAKPGIESRAVRIITMKDYKRAAQTLADAFAQDEVARYLLDTDDMEGYGEDVKMKLHTEILEYITAAHILKGVVTVVGDFEAVGLWMPPNTDSSDWITIFRSGMWRLFYKLSTEGRIRFYNEFLPLLHDTAHEVLSGKDKYNDEAWYLVYLGTKPGSRGRGLAGELLRWGIGMANSTNHPMYLESSAAVNVPYYKKFGFESVKDVFLVRGKKPVGLTIMIRKPSGPGGSGGDEQVGKAS